MTNDTKAPEQIYIFEEDAKEFRPTWFIHCDLHLALVAAAYGDAANLHQSLWRETSAYKTDQILKRTPDDAQAALDRMLQEEREKALREAAATITHDASRNTVYQKSRRDAGNAVLALIDQMKGGG